MPETFSGTEASDGVPHPSNPTQTLPQALAEWLGKVDRPGDFCTAGTCDLPAPGLAVAGVGPIALPLIPLQGEQLISVAEPAPFGRGTETLLDPTVRRTWQVAASKVTFSGRNWPQTFDAIVRRVAAGLGIPGEITAELHKLLLYGEGGFFREHRDTEKSDGMFGTLVIVLPSSHDGGELVVRHQDREVALDMRPQDPAEARFAAFYSDCRHEVKPVRSGYRLTLVYNLLNKSSRPAPPIYDKPRDAVSKLLAEWGERDPIKLVYPLEHAYTADALAFDTLKGVDATRAALLVAAAEQVRCDAHLALLTVEEGGIAEHVVGPRYHRRHWSDEEEEDEFEAIEVCERTESLSEWRQPNGYDPGFGTLPLDESELVPPGALDYLDPTEQAFHEATGNEGASFSRTYRVAAVVLWPHHHWMKVLNQGGLGTTVPVLTRLSRAAGADRTRSEWNDAHALADVMLQSWPRRSRNVSAGAVPFLEALASLKDTDSIVSFMANVAAEGFFGRADAAAMARALRLLPSATAAELLTRISGGPGSLDARAALLAQCCDQDLTQAADCLVASLPEAAVQSNAFPRALRIAPAIVVDIVHVLTACAPTLLDQAIQAFLQAPQHWDMDGVLIPAALEIGHSAPRLKEICIAHLIARTAQPLFPPPDWARDATLSCRCGHCTTLARFLSDPTAETWHLKAPEDIRSHVQTTIANSGCDLDTVTSTKGRPYTLVCTKNRASYERRVQQRQQDLALLDRLRR